MRRITMVVFALLLTSAVACDQPPTAAGDPGADASAANATIAPQGGQPGSLALVVESTVPGNAPSGIAAIRTRAETHFLVVNFASDEVSRLGIDPITGHLTLLGTATTGDGPSAVATSGNGKFAAVSSILDNSVEALRIDRATGLLTLLGTATTGGVGPGAVALSDDGRYLIIANRDSDNLGVLHVDPTSGALTLASLAPAGDRPWDIAVAGRNLVVGHAGSNDLTQYRLDPASGTLSPVGSVPQGSPVLAVAVHGNTVAAGTVSGDIRTYDITANQLREIGALSTGDIITDMAFSSRGTLFVASASPGSVKAYDRDGRGVYRQVGAVSLSGVSLRNLATVQSGREDWVVVTELSENRTRLIRATPEPF